MTKKYGVWVTRPDGSGDWCKRLGEPFELIRTTEDDAKYCRRQFELSFPPGIKYEVREV
jgi:hypothetical protein